MQDYEGGLFGCFQDPVNCIFTCFCGCCQNAKNWAKAAEYPYSCIVCCEPVHPVWVRRQILRQNGLSEDEVMDCLCATFCGPCTICQDSRKLGTSDPTEIPAVPTTNAVNNAKSAPPPEQHSPPPPPPPQPQPAMPAAPPPQHKEESSSSSSSSSSSKKVKEV